MDKYHPPLEAGSYYHIYNRANGAEKLYMNSDDYRHFLRKYHQHTSPIADTICYCLMPNHFHLLVRIRTENEIRRHFQADRQLQQLLSTPFQALFSSFAQTCNRKRKRRGSLFMKNFKRIKIQSDAYIKSLTTYIHNNPVESGLCTSPEKWPYSSFTDLIKQREPDRIQTELMELFGGKDNFLAAHKLFQTNMPDN